jgi:Protein of unknown function (DUF1592)/Protein of unknown function (DUF1588)/Protein of unknown function (DUF1595)/Protein of unknown function (DUF1585)
MVLAALGVVATAACGGDEIAGSSGSLAPTMGSVPSSGVSGAMPTASVGGPIPTPSATPGGDPTVGPIPTGTDMPPVGTEPTGTTTTPNPTATETPPPVAGCAVSPITHGLVLLSDIQYVNGIRAVVDEAALTADNLPVEEEKQFSRKLLALNTSLVVTRMDWAEDAGSSVAGRFSEVTECQDGDTACAQTYIEELARSAFRRAVTAEEVTELMAVFASGNQTSFGRGIGLTIEAILSSPSFFYRTEFGVPGADGLLQLTPTEFAAELSYLLTDGPPDKELLDAAIDGTLVDPEVSAAHVERILGNAETQTNLTSTMMAAWSFGNLAGATKDEEMFPDFGALRPRMYQETKLFLQDVFWSRNADVSEVLSSPTTFVDGMLAELYGVDFPGDNPDEFVEVTLPADQRAGILTQASVMAARSRTDRTSVVSRGIFVRGDLMCLPKLALPDGNPELQALITEQSEDDSLSELEKSELRAESSTCGACHSQFDAFGVPLEFYDPIGRYVPQTDDTTVDLSVVGGLNAGAPSATDGVELALALAAAPQFKSCVTRHVLSYGLGSDELAATSCEVSQAVASLPATATMGDIVRTVASSPSLWVRGPEATP